MEEENKKDTIHDKVKEETEKVIDDILNEGIKSENVDFLYKVIDIHKDIANEHYWKEKEKNMRYRNSGRGMYGNYDMMDDYGSVDVETAEDVIWNVVEIENIVVKNIWKICMIITKCT